MDPREVDDTRHFSKDERAWAHGDLLPGTSAGAYVVTRFIDRGGGGSVYEARHLTLPRRAAVKVLHGRLAALPKMVERFTREIQVLNLLRHPNIVEVYEVGVLPDGRPFYVMEYVGGETLHHVLKARERLSPEQALAILDPVCGALAAAHAASIIHRDVKASNISIDDGDPPTVKLLDFGIAKLLGKDQASSETTAGRQIGTLTIMAPEQLMAGPVDARTDVYALGVLLYRMLTGRLPFRGRSLGALVQQHMEQPAPRPSQETPLAPALDVIVLRCMEKTPERRFESVTSFLAALRAAVGKPIGADAPQRDAVARGVGIYLDVRMGCDGDELDDAVGDDIGCILDLVEGTLEAEGFRVAWSTGSGALGVRQLSDDAGTARQGRKAAVELALALHDALGRRPTADARVHPTLCLHADEVLVRTSSAPEIIGGALIRTERWAPRSPVTRVCATPEALEDVSGFDLTRGPDPLMMVAPGE